MEIAELSHLRKSAEASIKRALIFWTLRWLIGFSVIAIITYYMPSARWLWYLGAGACLVSLIFLVTMRLLFSKQVRKTQDATVTLQKLLVPEDDELKSMLIGKWHISVTNDGVLTSGTTDYRDDGTFVSLGLIEFGNGVPPMKMEFEGSWSVKGKALIWNVEKSSEEDVMPIGTSATEQILQISRDSMTHQSTDGTACTEMRVT